MGEDHDTSPSKLSKEELIQSMDRVDREIAKVEQQIFKLKKKQVHYLTINLLRNTSLVETNNGSKNPKPRSYQMNHEYIYVCSPPFDLCEYRQTHRQQISMLSIFFPVPWLWLSIKMLCIAVAP